MNMSEYSGDPKNCCLLMDWALDENYLEKPIMLNWSSGGTMSVGTPIIHGPTLTPTGKKHKPNVFISYCPFCGSKLSYEEGSK